MGSLDYAFYGRKLGESYGHIKKRFAYTVKGTGKTSQKKITKTMLIIMSSVSLQFWLPLQ